MTKVENNLTQQNRQKLIKYNIIRKNEEQTDDQKFSASDATNNSLTFKKRTFISLTESKALRKRSFNDTELTQDDPQFKNVAKRFCFENLVAETAHDLLKTSLESRKMSEDN